MQGSGQVVTGSLPAVQNDGLGAKLPAATGGIIVVSVQDDPAKGALDLFTADNSQTPLAAVDGNGKQYTLIPETDTFVPRTSTPSAYM